jgi:enamine deaminase RidA (YjgF/YER057c/UK114 family)
MVGGTAIRVESGSPYAPSIGFSAAIRSGGLVTVAGMTAVDPAGRLVGEAAYDQAREALRKVEAAVLAAGATLEHVVQTRIYLVDREDWPEVGRAHGDVFGDIRPTATMVVVAALLDPRMRVEIEAIAHLPER